MPQKKSPCPCRKLDSERNGGAIPSALMIELRHQVSVVQRTKTRRPMLASDRARCGESLQIQQHPLGKFGMYARVSHIVLSLLGPVYFGYVHSPYVVLVVWSAACAAIFFWSNRASLRH